MYKRQELLLLLEKLEQFHHMTLTEQASIEESEGHRLSVNFNLIFTPEGQVKTVGPEEDQG